MRARSPSKPRIVNLGDREDEFANASLDLGSRLAVEYGREFVIGWL